MILNLLQLICDFSTTIYTYTMIYFYIIDNIMYVISDLDDYLYFKKAFAF